MKEVIRHIVLYSKKKDVSFITTNPSTLNKKKGQPKHFCFVVPFLQIGQSAVVKPLKIVS